MSPLPPPRITAAAALLEGSRTSHRVSDDRKRATSTCFSLPKTASLPATVLPSTASEAEAQSSETAPCALGGMTKREGNNKACTLGVLVKNADQCLPQGVELAATVTQCPGTPAPK